MVIDLLRADAEDRRADAVIDLSPVGVGSAPVEKLSLGALT